MGYYRARPDLLKQSKSYSCWAACLEAWSRSTKKMPKLREKKLIKEYGIDDNGGLQISSLYKLHNDLFSEGLRMTVKETSNLLPDDFHYWLKTNYFMLIYQTAPGSTDWHAWLGYGVDNFLCYMDPRYGDYRKKSVYGVTSPNGFYIFWMP